MSIVLPQFFEHMLSTTYTAPQFLVDNGATIVNSIFILKAFTILQVYIYDLLVYSYVSANPTTGMATLTADAKSLLGVFYFPIVYLTFLPNYLAGSESLGSFADFLTFVLFNFVGASLDPTNSFCKVMFLYLPTALNIVQFIATLSNKNKIYGMLFQGGSSVLSYVFVFWTILSGLSLSTLYAFVPQLIADAVYFPGTL